MHTGCVHSCVFCQHHEKRFYFYFYLTFRRSGHRNYCLISITWQHWKLVRRGKPDVVPCSIVGFSKASFRFRCGLKSRPQLMLKSMVPKLLKRIIGSRDIGWTVPTRIRADCTHRVSGPNLMILRTHCNIMQLSRQIQGGSRNFRKL